MNQQPWLQVINLSPLITPMKEEKRDFLPELSDRIATSPSLHPKIPEPANSLRVGRQIPLSHPPSDTTTCKANT